MKIGLICRDDIRQEILKLLKANGVSIEKQADIYMVEEGMHQGFLPCIVFNRKDLTELSTFLAYFTETSNASKITGFKNNSYYIIDEKDILYFEANNSKVLCHTFQEVYEIKEKLFELEGRLSNERFIKVSRSYIVNIESVTRIVPWFNRRLLLKFEPSIEEVEVSKNYVPDFKQFLGIR